MPKTFTLQKGKDESGVVQASVLKLLNQANIGSLATVNIDATPHINTCYLAASKDWKLYFLSSPKSSHAKNLVRQPFCALTLADSEQRFGTELQGLQLFGTAKQLSPKESLHAFTTYTKKFPEFLRWATDVRAVLDHFEDRFFAFTIATGKLLDEPAFGKEVYIDFSVK